MAIPRMEADVEIISKLGDVPGSDDGLSPQQLKGKFDLAAVRIKDFINNILLPELNNIVDVKALLDNVLDNTLTKEDKAANAKATGDALNNKLDKAGGSITGDIAMNGNKMTGVGAPSESTDAVNKSYVDGKYLAAQIILPASGWSAEAPYTQTVAVEGMLETDRPHYGVVYSADADTRLGEKEAFALVDDLDSAAGSVTFTCFEDKPGIDLTIQLEVNR